MGGEVSQRRQHLSSEEMGSLCQKDVPAGDAGDAAVGERECVKWPTTRDPGGLHPAWSWPREDFSAEALNSQS